jgi:translation initiation factor IF-3
VGSAIPALVPAINSANFGIHGNYGNSINAIISKSSRFQEDRIDKRFIRMNERIRAREIRVIDADGNQLGIMPPHEALRKAREQNFDLVEISPNAIPPVCRIMDYGKFLYENEKKERAAKKNQKQIVLKEVKFSVNVDEHDYITKKNHVLRFLTEGDKVKASLRFRGREMAHQNLGRNVLERLLKEVGDKGIVEFRPRMEGNTMHLILAPPKQVPGAKKQEKPQTPQQQQARPQQVQQQATQPQQQPPQQPAGGETPTGT